MFPPPPSHIEELSKVETSPSEKYEPIKKIGEGGYSSVLKAVIKNNRDAGFFVLKINRHPGYEGKVTMIDYNEVKMLQKLKKEKHIVKLIELVRDKNVFSLVLEYCIVDLTTILYQPIAVRVNDIKNILIQLFTGLKAMHGYNIMHRDLKPANILLSLDGIVKITDFGNAIEMGHLPTLNTNICTIWYKSPELIFGHGHYNETVDLWSAGCLATEFFMRQPALFKGNDDVSQMEKISELCGFCSEAVWPEAKEFPNYKNLHAAFGKYTEDNLPKRLLQVTRHQGAANFLGRLLKLNAGQRMTAAQALKDVYFESAPSPSPDLNQLLKTLQLKKLAF